MASRKEAAGALLYDRRRLVNMAGEGGPHSAGSPGDRRVTKQPRASLSAVGGNNEARSQNDECRYGRTSETDERAPNLRPAPRVASVRSPRAISGVGIPVDGSVGTGLVHELEPDPCLASH